MRFSKRLRHALTAADVLPYSWAIFALGCGRTQRNEIATQVCVSDVTGTTLSYTSISGSPSLKPELTVAPSGQRVSKLSSIISEPG